MMKHSYIRSFHASYRSNLFQIVIERHILPWMSERLAPPQLLLLFNLLKTYIANVCRYRFQFTCRMSTAFSVSVKCIAARAM
ncbi:hypothetical protein E6O75_ATG00719 [Venturia nashicola]|uniref:Uncharacterized protein n=1 Tax=Venturia nashicola TaxID=86259 RepID=A0A4Z1PXM9_9PEZI|nr:hypothetical protein E6O75_ATG00719 [Venturia nashicola]